MAKEEAKPNGKDEKPPEPVAFDDSEFFASEGVAEDEEKNAIRSRARVIRYVNWRTAKEAEADDPKKKKKSTAERKPWYTNE
jgi:hypothetical protein